jgi:threonine/homoserine/homoserine lactone efflux protein
MLGFAGPIDAQTILALALSALLNAIIYAVAASLLYAAWQAFRRENTPDRAAEKD